MTNPTNLTWQAPTTYSDKATPFAQTDFAGWQIDIDGTAAVSVPVAWNTAGTYSMPLKTIPALVAQGSHTIDMRTVAANGNVSAPSTTVTYSYDARVPLPPLAVAVA